MKDSVGVFTFRSTFEKLFSESPFQYKLKSDWQSPGELHSPSRHGYDNGSYFKFPFSYWGGVIILISFVLAILIDMMDNLKINQIVNDNTSVNSSSN